MKNLEYTKLW